MKLNAFAQVYVELLAIVRPPPAFGESRNRTTIGAQLCETFETKRRCGLANPEIRTFNEPFGLSDDELCSRR